MPGDVVTYNYTLEGGHTYHIYLIGEYANLTRHLTDYDIFLYKEAEDESLFLSCLLYTSPSPRDQRGSRMPSSA